MIKQTRTSFISCGQKPNRIFVESFHFPEAISVFEAIARNTTTCKYLFSQRWKIFFSRPWPEHIFIVSQCCCTSSFLLLFILFVVEVVVFVVFIAVAMEAQTWKQTIYLHKQVLSKNYFTRKSV